MFVRLELGYLLLPVRVEDVAVVTREALVYLPVSAAGAVDAAEARAYVLPGTGEELRIRSLVLRGNLDQISATGSWRQPWMGREDLPLRMRLEDWVSRGRCSACDSWRWAGGRREKQRNVP